MSIFDKRLSKEEREALELAEDSREREWKYPSFVSRLFQGTVEWDLIFPFPEQNKQEKEIAGVFLKRVILVIWWDRIQLQFERAV